MSIKGLVEHANGWLSYHGGARWRRRDDGRLELEGGERTMDAANISAAADRLLIVDADSCPRTSGQPQTMRTEIGRWGGDMDELVEEFGLSAREAATMWGIIGVEAGRSRRQRGRDIFSIRYEPGFEGFDASDWDGAFSAGLVQTTMETARHVARKIGAVVVDLHGNPRELQPGDLCIPRVSLHLGLYHLKELIERYDTTDPLLLQMAWNTGNMGWKDEGEVMRLYNKHGDERVFLFMAWHNDAVAVLTERAA